MAASPHWLLTEAWYFPRGPRGLPVWLLASPRADDPRVRARAEHSVFNELVPRPEGHGCESLEAGLAGAVLEAGHFSFSIVALTKKLRLQEARSLPRCHSWMQT